MKTIAGFTIGGLQKKTIRLVLMIVLVTVAVFTVISVYQSRMLVDLVQETKAEQQAAISQTSKETMAQVMESTMVKTTELNARSADNDFAEVVHNVRMLQTMAQGVFESRDLLTPVEYHLPDPAMDGTISSMVLCEAGVDYTESEYLGTVAHLSDPMIAMYSNSDKISGCYIGLADGTHFGIDELFSNKYDAEGKLIPFPVRERPWYRGAVETGELYFTGIEKDAFTETLGITCSAPIVVSGEIVGVVGIDIRLDSMKSIIDSSIESGSFSFIVNNDGQVILAPDENGMVTIETADQAQDLREHDNPAVADLIRTALKETTGLRTITSDGKEYYVVGAPMSTIGWAVVSVVDKELTEQPEKLMLAEYDTINDTASMQFQKGTARTNRNIIVIIAIILLLGIFASLFVTRTIVKPITDMTEDITISSRTGKLFEMKDSYRTDDEIELLAEAFDDLSKKTKKYIEDITRITREKERVSTELHMANQIQTAMLPHVFPPFPGRKEFDIFAVMNPAREVGGDFYDFFMIDDDHLCMVMADVSGKGVPAALFMMISKVILQSCAMLGQSVSEILAKTNEALCSNNQVEMFVTVWLGVLDINTGIITAANAGHEYPALMKNGEFALLKDKHGFILGGLNGMKYKEYEIQMKPGDKLFLYTDGVPEATDAEDRLFGTGRMLEALNAEPCAEPKKILENVQSAVESFVNSSEQFDDLTMLCIEYRGSNGDA